MFRSDYTAHYLFDPKLGKSSPNNTSTHFFHFSWVELCNWSIFVVYLHCILGSVLQRYSPNYWEPNTNLSSESLVTIPLNDNFEGGEFTVAGKVIDQQIGQAIQINCDPFSPDTSPVHGVKTVTEGTRYALVFWNFS